MVASGMPVRISKFMKEYYQILGLKVGATTREIKSAYRRLAKKYHPDRNSGLMAKEQFMQVHEAYQMLTDDNFKVAIKRASEKSKPKNKSTIAYAVYVTPRQKVCRFFVHARRQEIIDANTREFPDWALYLISVVGFVIVAIVGAWIHIAFKEYKESQEYRYNRYKVERSEPFTNYDNSESLAYLTLGQQKASMQQYQQALTYYEQAIEKAKYPEAIYYLSRGNCLVALERYEEASLDYDKALEQRPTPEQEAAILSRAADLNAYILDSYRKALRYYDRLVLLTPEDADAWFGRAYSRQQNGIYYESIADFDAALALGIDSGKVCYYKGYAYLGIGDSLSACSNFETAIRHDPSYGDKVPAVSCLLN